VTHVSYRGAAPAMTDLLSGQVQLKLDTVATSAPFAAEGRLRVLAYAGRIRSAVMPDVPTVAEMGLPGYEGVLWIGLLAPAATPRAIIDRLAAATARAVRSPDLAARLARDGIDPVGGTPAEFAALIAREITQWRDVIAAAKIKSE
jgi:tripartite-type tricarboxylate transporter receptor subunit TctC